MATLYGRTWTRAEILRKIGDISQVGGVDLVELQEGRAQGVRAVRFRTGVLDFTVLAGKCMDVYDFGYRGTPLAWHSPTGIAAAPYLEDSGLRLLRTFQGGLLMTCGLTTMGAPSVDQGEELGLHGRVHHLPASNVCVDAKWEGDDYVMWAEGKVRQAALFGENLVLRRRVTAKLGEAKVLISDVVENEGYSTVPHMILYHINAGFPLVDEGARLLVSSKVTPRDPDSEKGLADCCRFTAPIPGCAEQVFFHDVAADAAGLATAALVNEAFGGGQGLALYVRYPKAQLPVLNEWKMMGEGTYVVGMEPGNGFVSGRAAERARGTLQFLEPGESRHYDLEIGVLASRADIGALTAEIEALRP